MVTLWVCYGTVSIIPAKCPLFVSRLSRICWFRMGFVGFGLVLGGGTMDIVGLHPFVFVDMLGTERMVFAEDDTYAKKENGESNEGDGEEEVTHWIKN